MMFFKRTLFILVFTLGIVPFTQIISSTGPVQTTEFAIIFATGGLGDNSHNDAAWRGKEQAEEEYGDSINIDYVEPATIPEFATYQDDLAASGKYELIICFGFLQLSSLNYSARTYSNQDWVLIDEVLPISNVHSITFKEHEGSFLAGAMAGMVTQTNKIGFLGGLDIYMINKYKYGYLQGASYVNDTTTVTSVYSPDPTNPWGDISGGKLVAETLYSQGNDIIFAAAGGTGIGVMQAASETNDVYAIGTDYDQDHIYPGTVLCSALKKFETAVFTSIKAKMDGTWQSGHSQLGLAEDGVGISPMTYTEELRDGLFEFRGVTKTRWEHIIDIKELIRTGYILVDDASPEYWTTLPTSTTIPTTTTTTTTQSHPPTDETTPPVNTAIITPDVTRIFSLVTLSFGASFIRHRRKKQT